MAKEPQAPCAWAIAVGLSNLTLREFMTLLRKSLQSRPMNILIQSLIARTNEKRPFGPQPPTLPPSLLKPITPERKSNPPATPKKPPDAAEGDADK
jgi:hypothetical protein